MDWKKLIARRNLWLLLLAAVQIAFLGSRFVQDYHKGRALDVPAEMMDPYGADTAWKDGGGVHVEGHTGVFATTRWLDIEAGSYQVVINYENTGETGSVSMVDDVNRTARYDAASLPPERTQTVLSLWEPYRCQNAQFHFSAAGGRITVISVQLLPTHSMAYVHFLTALFWFLLLDAALLLWRGILTAPPVSVRQSALVIAAITALACLPLGMDFLPGGHDLAFHLSRIEGLKSGLLAGQFPVRIAPDLLNGKGYASSLMYGDILLYPAAVLRILGFSLQTVYKLYVIAVTAATALLARWVLRRMLGSEALALGGAALYVFSFYRLVNVYIRAAAGEYTAMLFLPLVVYGFWRLYTQKAGEPAAPWCWVPLALGFSGLLQTHLLTTLMAAVLAVVFCLLAARRTFTRPVLVPILKAAGATVVWNLWFLIPLFQMYFDKALRISARATNAFLIYQSAVPLGQLFLPGVPVAGQPSSLVNGMPLSVGTVLAAGALLALTALADPQVRGADRPLACTAGVGLGLGALALWLCSDLFPWYEIYQNHPALSRVVSSLQFAWRFLAPATALLTVAALCGLALWAKARPAAAHAALAALLVLALLPAGDLMFETVNSGEKKIYRSLASVDSMGQQAMGGEYLPAAFVEGPERAWGGNTPQFPDGTVVLDTARSGDSYILTLQNNSESAVTGTLPLLAYPGYRLTAGGDGLMLGAADGFETLTVPGNWAGTVTVDWATPRLWRAGDIFSVLAAAATLLVRRRWRRTGQKR